MNHYVRPEHFELAREWLNFGLEVSWPILMKSVGWALLFSLVGLLLALMMCLCLHRYRLLRREHRVWNRLAKLSYLIVLLSGVMIGAITGAVFGVQRDLNQILNTQLQPMLEKQMPYLRVFLAGHLVEKAGNEMITARDLVQPLVQDFLYQPKSDGYIESIKAKVINRVVLQVGAVALKHAFHQALKQLPGVLQAASFVKGGSAGPNDQLIGFAVETVMQVLSGTAGKLDFSPLDRSVPEIFVAAVQEQVDGLFRPIYFGLGLKLLIVASLIGLEMLIYFRYYAARRKTAEPQCAFSEV